MPPRGTAPGLSTTDGDARYQPLDSDLTAIAALSTTPFGRALLALADAAAARLALAALGGSTGSTDNAVLRADGTGGSTAQSSGVVISDSGRIATYSGSALHAIYPPTVGTWSHSVAFNVVTLSDGDGSYDIYCILDLTRTAGGSLVQQGGQIRIRALRTAGTVAIRHSAMSSYLGAYAPPYTFSVSGDTIQATVTSLGHSGEYMTACTLAYAAVDLES